MHVRRSNSLSLFPLLVAFASLAPLACSMTSGDQSDDVGQAKKVEPTDGVAVLLVTVPASLPLKSTSTLSFPTLLGGNYGEWDFDYVINSEHDAVTPGTPISVRPGGCLYTSFRSLVQGGYTLIAQKNCNLGLAADQKTEIDFGGVRVHYGTDPLTVDFGHQAAPRLFDASGNPVYPIPGAQTFGAQVSYNEGVTYPVPWAFNARYSGSVTDYVAVPVLAGSYVMDFGVPGLAKSQAVTVTAGQIADVDTTPSDIRSTAHFDDDGPNPFPEGALQTLTLTVAGDTNAGYHRLATGGFDAKFFPSGNGPNDVVSYHLDSGDTGKQLTVPASAKASAVLSRIDVDDVAVSNGSGTTTVKGTWLLETQNAQGQWSTFNTCYSTDAYNRCTGGASAARLQTKSGVYVPDGHYRVTVTYQTAADPSPQSKIYPVDIP